VEELVLRLEGAISYNFVQAGIGIGSFHYFTAWSGSKTNEIQTQIGLSAVFGNALNRNSYLPDVLYPIDNKEYAIGFALLNYWDDVHCSQRSGLIGLQSGSFRIRVENDVFAGTGQDKFRTGAWLVAYTHGVYDFGVGNILWTGNANSPLAIRINDSTYPSRFGYKNLSNAPYGKISKGILYGFGGIIFNYGQVATCRI
jgi:Bacterial toxin 23